MVNGQTLNAKTSRDPQTALKMRLRGVAATRVRLACRRLTVMLRREGWPVNAKRIYRLYTADGLAVRTKMRKKDPATYTHTGTRCNGAQRKVVDGVCRRPPTRWTLGPSAYCRRPGYTGVSAASC